MKSILITGGAGFIGSHTCLQLLQQDYFLYILDSYVNSSPKIAERLDKLLCQINQKLRDKFKFIEGDIRDESMIDGIFKCSINENRPIEGVIHFAGLKSVAESVSSPSLYWDVNVGGTIKLIRIMEKYSCRTIVFSSSATIYSENNRSPLSEDSEIKPYNPYGQTKANIENLLKDLYTSNDSCWRVINLRYFNPIGAHPSGLIGEEPRGKINNLFPYLNQVASGNIKELKIYGNDWPTIDGTGVRDYIHIMDLADAHCLALNYLIKEKKATLLSINIGTGRGTSVLQLLKTFESVNSCKIPFRFVDRRLGDIAISYASNDLASSILSWRPKRNLSNMCIDGWRWQKLNPYGYE